MTYSGSNASPRAVLVRTGLPRATNYAQLNRNVLNLLTKSNSASQIVTSSYRIELPHCIWFNSLMSPCCFFIGMNRIDSSGVIESKEKTKEKDNWFFFIFRKYKLCLLWLSFIHYLKLNFMKNENILISCLTLNLCDIHYYETRRLGILHCTDARCCCGFVHSLEDSFRIKNDFHIWTGLFACHPQLLLPNNLFFNTSSLSNRLHHRQPHRLIVNFQFVFWDWSY